MTRLAASVMIPWPQWGGPSQYPSPARCMGQFGSSETAPIIAGGDSDIVMADDDDVEVVSSASADENDEEDATLAVDPNNYGIVAESANAVPSGRSSGRRKVPLGVAPAGKEFSL